MLFRSHSAQRASGGDGGAQGSGGEQEHDQEQQRPDDAVGDHVDGRDPDEQVEVQREDAPQGVGEQAEEDADAALRLGKAESAQETVQVSLPLSSD